MINNTMLVGKVADGIKKVEFKGKEYYSLIIELEENLIEVLLWDNEEFISRLHKGDLISVKGKIASEIVEVPIGNMYITKVIAEKVCFLSKEISE